MKVLKFGGTSVGTPESLAHVKQIVEKINGFSLIVVSALGGLTDKLISTAKEAASGQNIYIQHVEEIRNRHYAVISSVIEKEKQLSVLDDIEKLLNELSDLYDGVALIGSLPVSTLDKIVSFGERMSSVIVTNMISGARHLNTLNLIKTEKWFNKNTADVALTEKLIKEYFKENSFNGPVICGGFISTDRETGEITNLGRGGSDYTAALFAATLDAECLEIWTDVDGFMTSDPRIIPSAKVINSLSFVESMELCSFGAKVIYPPTIYPVFHKNIPIRILNTFNCTAPGTWITDRKEIPKSEVNVKGITSLNQVTLVTIKGKTVENLPEINSRTYNALAKNGISVLLVSTPTADPHFSFVVGANDSEKSNEILTSEFAPDIQNGDITGIEFQPSMSIIAVVGEGIGKAPGIGWRVHNTLERHGIIVRASSQGAAFATYACVVDEEVTKEALKCVHELFFD